MCLASPTKARTKLQITLCSPVNQRLHHVTRPAVPDTHARTHTHISWTMERGSLLVKTIELPTRFVRRLFQGIVCSVQRLSWSSHLKLYNRSLFLTQNNPYKTPSKDNLARWLKDTLKKGGIEMKDFLHILRVVPVPPELRVKCL